MRGGCFSTPYHSWSDSFGLEGDRLGAAGNQPPVSGGCLRLRALILLGSGDPPLQTWEPLLQLSSFFGLGLFGCIS